MSSKRTVSVSIAGREEAKSIARNLVIGAVAGDVATTIELVDLVRAITFVGEYWVQVSHLENTDVAELVAAVEAVKQAAPAWEVSAESLSNALIAMAGIPQIVDWIRVSHNEPFGALIRPLGFLTGHNSAETVSGRGVETSIGPPQARNEPENKFDKEVETRDTEVP